MENNTNPSDNSENKKAEDIDDLDGFEQKTGPAAFEQVTENEYLDPTGIENNLELENALDQIRRLEEELESVKDKMLREAAEVENIRRRSQKEREDARKFSIAGFAKDLLDVADNFSRALESAPENRDEMDERIKSLLEGIEATQRSMLRTFERNGITKIEPMDQKFDPNMHEVMFEAPMPDKENGIIMQIIENGYTLNDRLLRPARVGITKNTDLPKGEHMLDQEV